MHLEWEYMDDRDSSCIIRRSKTPTGWLVHFTRQVGHYADDVKITDSITFVPDPNHEWLTNKNRDEYLAQFEIEK